MSLILGNTTYANPTVGATVYTTSHTQDAGSGGLLLVALCMANTTDYASLTYDGVAMTQQLNYASASLSQRWAFFTLENPSSGSNSLVLTLSSPQFNPLSASIMSFTGSSGIGVVGNNDVSPTPHSRNMTIQNNSLIYATGVSINSQSFGYDIAGITVPNLFNHNTNRQVEGALSTSGLPSGVTTVVTKADFGSISNARIEILEAPENGVSGNFMLLL
jgi:hypothetical protein